MKKGCREMQGRVAIGSFFFFAVGHLHLMDINLFTPLLGQKISFVTTENNVTLFLLFEDIQIP